MKRHGHIRFLNGCVKKCITIVLIYKRNLNKGGQKKAKPSKNFKKANSKTIEPLSKFKKTSRYPIQEPTRGRNHFKLEFIKSSLKFQKPKTPVSWLGTMKRTCFDRGPISFRKSID